MAVLEVRSLKKCYGRTEAVRDVSLSVERGQVFGLLGPNGSGKTTTLACALGLVRPSHGEVRILGEPSHHIHRTRGRVGAVFDRDCLLAGSSVRQNLEYVRRLARRRGGRTPSDVLELMGIADLARRRVARLSLGQKKRVSVACALLGEPELLVLDEPLSALDTLGARAMLALIRRLADEGTTLILSSHRLHEMQTVITHAGIIAGGRLLRAGALGELLGTGSARYRIRLAPPLPSGGSIEGVLARLGASEHRERRETAAGVELAVLLDGRPAAELNRELVLAGFAVSALEPERGDLHALFESLVGEGAGS